MNEITTEQRARSRAKATLLPVRPLQLFDSVQLERHVIPQHQLDIANRTRTNLFPWRGQFSPQLVEILLSHYAASGSYVLDPFVGVGTTLFEAARQGLPCLGTEINPAAVTMAESCIFVQQSDNQRQRALSNARWLLDESLPDVLGLFSNSRTRATSASEAIIGLVRTRRRSPLLKNILANTLIRLIDTKGPKDGTAALRCFDQHRRVLLDLPHCDAECRVEHADARNLPLRSGSVDVVLTSPPYINVFNYHQNNRPAMELLGWDLLTVARSEFGSNRKNRGNRFLTVVQYCIDMTTTFVELKRVLKSGGRAIIIVGRESNVRGVSFQNGSIVAAVAALAGFRLDMRQERKFHNKFGDLIYEDILHLCPDEQHSVGISPSDLAQEALDDAISRAPSGEIRGDIEAAIHQAPNVPASPIFEQELALQ